MTNDPDSDAGIVFVKLDAMTAPGLQAEIRAGCRRWLAARRVFAADCNEYGNCPRCEIDYAECGCIGPTQDGLGDVRYRGGERKSDFQGRQV